jgi:hypothetical protein
MTTAALYEAAPLPQSEGVQIEEPKFIFCEPMADRLFALGRLSIVGHRDSNLVTARVFGISKCRLNASLSRICRRAWRSLSDDEWHRADAKAVRKARNLLLDDEELFTQAGRLLRDPFLQMGALSEIQFGKTSPLQRDD